MVTSVPEPAIAKLFSSWPSRIALGPPTNVSLLLASICGYCPLPSVCVPGANHRWCSPGARLQRSKSCPHSGPSRHQAERRRGR